MHCRELERVLKICELMFYNSVNDSAKFEFASDLKCTNDTTLLRICECFEVHK